MEKSLFEIYQSPKLQSPSLIVGWQTPDIGKLGLRVINFLNEKLEGREVGEIRPSGFFPLAGAAFKDDLIQFPESKFWACEKNDLLLFKSGEPRYDRYKFLNIVLDLAKYNCKAEELYTISGTPSLTAHTTPRRILAVFNQPEFQEKLQGFGLENMTWEGPPAISSYLLWIAKRRGIPGVSLWPEVPFYLAAREDPQAIKLTLSFLDKKFNLGMDLRGLDLEIRNLNEKIAQLRNGNAEINKYINQLESGLSLNEEEQTKLAKEVYELLEERC
jgi:proteasome assembly chaperone (PAC2) family protein